MVGVEDDQSEQVFEVYDASPGGAVSSKSDNWYPSIGVRGGLLDRAPQIESLSALDLDVVALELVDEVVIESSVTPSSNPNCSKDISNFSFTPDTLGPTLPSCHRSSIRAFGLSPSRRGGAEGFH